MMPRVSIAGARRLRLGLPLLLALLTMVSGCATRHRRPPPPPASAAQEALAPPTTVLAIEPLSAEDMAPPPFVLGPGDKVEVELIGLPNTRRVCLVLPDGRIHYDLLAGLRVEGLSVEELRVLLEDELATWYRSPQVGITVRAVNSRRVWILGRVNTPGIYPLDQPITLLEGIARAGGLFTSRFSGTTEELADLRHSFVMREGKPLPVDFVRLLEEGDTTQNIALAPGDFIYLPSVLNQQIYVLGAVNSPKAIGFRNRITLASALAAARDVRPGARTGEIVILRGSLAQPEVYVVDYDAILRGQAKDVDLAPLDIVWVPDRPGGTLERYARTAVEAFVRTLAANEGANFAVDGGKASIVTPVSGP